ncbi:MAG: sodium:solute symporter family protein [Rubrobacter sp.]|nr:sodium:solute symporter family protein [Rubrobacter sp.]
MDDLTFGEFSGIAVLVGYAAVMLLIGYVAGRGQPNIRESVKGYYLAGGGLGFVALFFTLYATQYSGNTVIGYAPTAYRQGFPWLQSIMFMTFIIGAYLVFAPRLYAIAKRESFVTPADWIRHRFQSTAVTLLAVLLMLWGLGNYLLEQLVAIGQGISGLTGDTVPYQIGVVMFVAVMLAYAWMGGMKAVAFTDVMQGIALLVGVAVLLGGSFYLIGGSIGEATQYLIQNEPEKASVPPLEVSANWLSLVLMVGFGAAVYPHAIQRIYAAESERTLKRSLAGMAWMPPITTGLVFVVGIIGISLFPNLSEGDSEQLVGMIANEVAAINIFFYVMMILLFGGIVAAIVSTADSALLSFSSMISKDLYARHINPEASEGRQVLVGKLWGILAVAVLLVIAWNPPTTLYNIFVLKFELIVQIAPAFIIGLYWKRLSSWPVFFGMLAGAMLAGGMTLFGVGTVYGVHGGIIGLALNISICVVGSLLVPASKEEAARAERSAELSVR